MANQVYANGREISCKAADGKSIAAFPDVCFTPPQTPATPPGVPIPYPNTGVSSDTSDGSKNVKISGKEIMMKDSSPFSKTSGNEAGNAPKKGIITSKNTGKAFFNSWSMDVKVEGSNVVRHLDLTTHNHGSMPGNTPTWPYLDKMAIKNADDGPCAKYIEKEREACGKVEKRVSNKAKAGKIRKNSINKTLRESYCKDRACNAARKCMLQPFNPDQKKGQSGCCEGKTPHHVIPAHCFMPPGERKKGGPQRVPGCSGYDDNKAPCICVSGKDKHTGQHKRIHKKFDKKEDSNLVNGKAGTWTYDQAAAAGAQSVQSVTRCSKACIRSQLDAYHQKKTGTPKIKNDTNLRADSTGVRGPGRKKVTQQVTIS